jgi:hypothetical protein
LTSLIKPANLTVIFCRVFVCSLISFVFVVTVFRASVQSIAHDEALTYEWFLDGSVYKVLMFNSTNHVLFTIIAKFFVKLFGTNELSLRTPSLIGATGYLTFTYLLCRKLFGDGILLLISMAMLCLNPLLMDFMAAARGYSLGLAFLAAAMYVMARLVDRVTFNPDDPERQRDCAIASILLALSVAASLTNLFPAASLAFSFLAIAFRWPLNFTWFDARALRTLAQFFIVPGVLVGLFILWPFLIQARPAQFNMGLHRASDALRDLFNSSFLYKWTGDVYAFSLGAVPPSSGSWQQRLSDFGVYVIFPVLFFFVFLGLISVSRSSVVSRQRETVYCCLFGIAAIACVVLTVLFRVLLKVNYPVSRTCLYFIPLFTLSGLLLAREFVSRFPQYHLRPVGLIIAATVVFDYALSLNTEYFRYNAYDVISRQLFLCISNDARSRGLTGIRVGGTWWYEPEINFYRRRYNAEWMKPYDVKDRSYFWESPNSLVPADYDYFVFTPANDPGLTGPRMRTIFRDRVTNITVTAMDK